MSALLLPPGFLAAAINWQLLAAQDIGSLCIPLCHVRVFACSRCEDFALSMTSPCSTGTCLPSLDSPLHGLLVFFCSIGLTHVSDLPQTRWNLIVPFPHNCQLSMSLLFLSAVLVLYGATRKTIWQVFPIKGA